MVSNTSSVVRQKHAPDVAGMGLMAISTPTERARSPKDCRAISHMSCARLIGAGKGRRRKDGAPSSTYGASSAAAVSNDSTMRS